MNRFLILAVVLLFAGSHAVAQTQTFDNVRKFELRNTGNILEKDIIVGYYFFYKKDKVDKKTESFKITLMDNNLVVMKSFDVIRPEKTMLIESVFNGTAFLMEYYVKDDLEMITYDKAGKKLGSKKFEDLNKYERYRLAQIEESGLSNKSIYPLNDSSFVRQSLVKNDDIGFELEAYSNSMKSLWKYGSSKTSKDVESVDILFASPVYIAACVSKRSSPSSKKMDQFYLVLDAKTGKKILEKPLKEKGAELSLLNVFVDVEKKRNIILGEYYAPGDEIINSKSQGMYSMVLDMNGERENFKKYSWSRDLAKVLADVTDEKKSKTPPAIYFHKVYRSPTGKAIAIGEQYRKQASAAGIASFALSGGRNNVSTAEVKVMDMVVMEFDSANNITNAFNVSKKTTRVTLPSGAEFLSPAMLANYIKSFGGFDYAFTSIDPKRDRFYSVYNDYNKKLDDEKGSEKSDAMFGVILYEGGKTKTERIPINTDANVMWVAPAKPGYIAVGEYFKKKKEISYRLEKISY